jgi:RNA ligase (TIGR02306 family)
MSGINRKLASIQRVSKVEPLQNADTLEVATVLGWKCVVRKGDFHEGDIAAYFEIDSWLPEKPEFEFLRKNCWKENDNGKGFRIKTIRLRGQVSQGLLMRISELSGLAHRGTFEVGENLTEILEVGLYNPPIPAELKGLVKGQFPAFIQKTDEPRVQLLQSVLSRRKGLRCYVTEKVDGTSATYYLKGGEFGVCSRNLELLESSGNAHWAVARENKIEEKMRAFSEAHGGVDFALQGEIIGCGVNRNPLKVQGKKVLFFNLFDIAEYNYYSVDWFMVAVLEMGLETVPVLDMNFTLTDDMDALVKYSEGNSALNPSEKREGVVVRAFQEVLDLEMAKGFGSGRISFKVVNPQYLLDEE